jgi:hypothetical protein
LRVNGASPSWAEGVRRRLNCRIQICESGEFPAGSVLHGHVDTKR